MYKCTIEVDGEEITIHKGDVFNIHHTLDFVGDTLDSGDTVTVSDIMKTNDGVQFEIVVDGEPGRIETIYKFALENNLENDYMSREETDT